MNKRKYDSNIDFPLTCECFNFSYFSILIILSREEDSSYNQLSSQTNWYQLNVIWELMEHSTLVSLWYLVVIHRVASYRFMFHNIWKQRFPPPLSKWSVPMKSFISWNGVKQSITLFWKLTLHHFAFKKDRH